MVNGGSDAFYLLESERNAAGDIVDFRFVFLNPKGKQLIREDRECARPTSSANDTPSYGATGSLNN